jgi:osmotically-inducible protein OsmY
VKFSTTALAVFVCAGALATPVLAGIADQADMPPQAAVASDNDLQFRVSSALHSDPYLYARHIDVSIKDGSVVLSGFVANDWELDKAIRVAAEAAKPHQVIDNIEIKQGGRR